MGTSTKTTEKEEFMMGGCELGLIGWLKYGLLKFEDCDFNRLCSSATAGGMSGICPCQGCPWIVIPLCYSRRPLIMFGVCP